MHLNRRTWLGAMAGMALLPTIGKAKPDRMARFLTAWQAGEQSFVGLLSAEDSLLAETHRLPVPTRAHGMLAEPGGTVLAVARRPGDWLVRWHPHTGYAQWHWLDNDCKLNGHAVLDAPAHRLWTTETWQDTGRGVLALRRADSLEKIDEWPTYGADPHQVLALPEAFGRFPAGTLMVANGGIATFTETGRAKRYIDQMDSSLVALHPTTGELMGQWRLPDRYLSIRHLAWNPETMQLGIALQAEHPDLTVRRNAPVLATWNGVALNLATQQPPMQGYGGDVCAHPKGGFVVSCPRADALAVFSAEGEYVETLTLSQATGVYSQGGPWWASGDDEVLSVSGGTKRQHHVASVAADRTKLDNHLVQIG